MAAKETDDLLKCQICNEACKRGVSVECCGAQACRACATKQVTLHRKCWNPTCSTELITDKLVNDETLRSAGTLAKAGKPVPKDLLDKIKERQKKVPEVEMVTHAPTPTNKPPTTSTTGPLDSRFLTKNPKAVPVTQKPAANQKVPQTPPANKIAAPVTNQKTPVASQANQSLAAKRKSETGLTLAESPKKGKFDGPLKVYMDATVAINSKGEKFIMQIFVSNSSTGDLRLAIAPDESIAKAAGNKHLSLRKKPGVNKDWEFIKSDGSKEDCVKPVYKGLNQLKNYFNALKTKEKGREIVLVMYSGVVYNLVWSEIKRLAHFKDIKACISHVLLIENYLKAKKCTRKNFQNKPGLSEIIEMHALNTNGGRPVDQVYKIEGLKYVKDCKDGVSQLKMLDAQTDQAVFIKTKLSLDPVNVPVNTKDKAGILVVTSSRLNMTTHDWLGGVTKDTNKDTTNKPNPQVSPAGAKPAPTVLKAAPPILKSALKKPAPSKMEAELEEIVILDEPSIAETIYLTGLYPVFTVPILVRLSNLDDGTRLVSFSEPYQATTSTDTHKYNSPHGKVFWRGSEAYSFFTIIPKLFPASDRFKTCPKTPFLVVPGKTSLKEVVPVSKSIEEARPFSKIVKVDLMFATDPNFTSDVAIKYVVEPNITSVVLVKIVPHANAALNSKGSSALQFNQRDVFLYVKSKMAGLEVVTHVFSPERRGNLAKIVFTSKSKMTITSGQILGTALLFQEENISLLLLKAEQQQTHVKRLGGTVEGQSVGSVQNTTAQLVKKVGTKTVQPAAGATQSVQVVSTVGTSVAMPAGGGAPSCSTLAPCAVYPGVTNLVLVSLGGLKTPKSGPQANQATLNLAQPFINSLGQTTSVTKKELAAPLTVPLIYINNTAHAFVPLKFGWATPPLSARAVKKDMVVASYSKLEHSGSVVAAAVLEMSACVDFTEKEKQIGEVPTLLKVYLKFTCNEIPKKEVLDQVFSVQKLYNSRLKVLTKVIRPLTEKRLAPQKTQTNDMMAELVLVSDGGTVTLNPREVIAQLVSVGHQLEHFKNKPNSLNAFKVCGTKFEPRINLDEYHEPEVEDARSIPTVVDRVTRMKERARQLGVQNSGLQRSQSSWDEQGVSGRGFNEGNRTMGDLEHDRRMNMDAHSWANDGPVMNRSMNDGPGMNRSMNDGPGNNRSMNDVPGMNRSMNDWPEMNRSMNDVPGMNRNFNDVPGMNRNFNDGPGMNRSMNESPFLLENRRFAEDRGMDRRLDDGPVRNPVFPEDRRFNDGERRSMEFNDRQGMMRSQEAGGMRMSQEAGGMRMSQDAGGMRMSQDAGGMRMSQEAGRMRGAEVGEDMAQAMQRQLAALEREGQQKMRLLQERGMLDSRVVNDWENIASGAAPGVDDFGRGGVDDFGRGGADPSWGRGRGGMDQSWVRDRSPVQAGPRYVGGAPPASRYSGGGGGLPYDPAEAFISENLAVVEGRRREDTREVVRRSVHEILAQNEAVEFGKPLGGGRRNGSDQGSGRELFQSARSKLFRN